MAGFLSMTKNNKRDELDRLRPLIEASGGGTSDLLNPALWLTESLVGSRTLSGTVVTPFTAFQLTAFFGGIRNISEDVGKLPMFIWEQTSSGRVKALNHPLFRMLNFKTSEFSSAQDFYQNMTGHGLNYGNAYAEIVRDQRGRPRELILIHPTRVEPFFMEDETGRAKLFYDVKGSGCNVRGEKFESIVLPERDMIHIKTLSPCGIVGYSVWQLGAQALGIGLAAQDFSATYFGNGTTLSGILTTDGSLDEESWNRLRNSWNETYAGTGNKNKTAILESGTTFQVMSSNAKESQLNETRSFTVLEVCRLLRIPAHKLCSMDAATFGNIEEQNLEYLRDTITSWTTRWSNELTDKLLDFPQFVAEQRIDFFAQGDSKTIAENVSTNIASGVLMPNEGREIQGLNPLETEGMNETFMQGAMATVESIAKGETTITSTSSSNSSNTSSETQASTQEKPEIRAEIDFEKEKHAYLPLFSHVASKIVTREANAMSKKFAKNLDDESKFKVWSRKFFDGQRDEIVNEFKPLCETFIKTVNLPDLSTKLSFITEFALEYANDGSEKSQKVFENQANDNLQSLDIAGDTEKLAKCVLDLLIENIKR